MKPETRPEIAKRLLSEAADLVERQQQLLVVLENKVHQTREAESLLDQLEQALTSFGRTLALLYFL